MQSLFRKVSGPRDNELIRGVVFFGLFFLFVWLWVDTTLIYHRHEQYLRNHICVPGTSEFSDLPAFAGQPIEYLAARLSHLFYYSWAGAVIITLTGVLLWLLTNKIFTKLSTGRLRLPGYVPGILLLMQYSRYYHQPADWLSLMIALVLAYIYITIPLLLQKF